MCQTGAGSSQEYGLFTHFFYCTICIGSSQAHYFLFYIHQVLNIPGMNEAVAAFTAGLVLHVRKACPRFNT